MDTGRTIAGVVPIALVALCVFACLAEERQSDPRPDDDSPVMVLDGNTTRENADEAIAVVMTFVQNWERGKHAKACALVLEPERENIRAYIVSRTARMGRIYSLKAQKSAIRKTDIWRAEVHFTLLPFEEMGMELIREKRSWRIARGFEEVTLLDTAVRASNADKVKRLLKDGADVNQPEYRQPCGPTTPSKRNISAGERGGTCSPTLGSVLRLSERSRRYHSVDAGAWMRS